MPGAGKALKQLVNENNPLKVIGVINPYCAMLAQQSGVEAIYLSGAGVANANFGLPDLGITSFADVLTEVDRICQASSLPLLVDGDTGWGSELNVEYAVRNLIKKGAAGVHFEDQAWPKRCGHRDNKKLIPADEMQAKIKAAVNTRDNLDKDFVIMARTDALASEGIDAAISRGKAYIESGADMIFAEAVTKLKEYSVFVKELNPVPILANITEFGKTPIFTDSELAGVGVKMMLFPLTAFRAMNFAAQNVFKEILREGTQKNITQQMQTRSELYEILNYESFESKVD